MLAEVYTQLQAFYITKVTMALTKGKLIGGRCDEIGFSIRSIKLYFKSDSGLLLLFSY